MACNKTTEQFESQPASDYLPLQVGKYITYRLDSTIFTNFGSVIAVHYYQEKQIVDAEISDNLGRPSYRILRFLRDSAGNQPWAPAGSYFITPTDKRIEVIENNFRIVKLVTPVILDNTWKGNRYLVSYTSDSLNKSDDPFSPKYSFENDDNMADWDFFYSSIDGSLTTNGKTYNNVLTVDVDIYKGILNASKTTPTAIDPGAPATVSYMQDIYAKGVGLIYQEFIMWDYQPPYSPTFGTQGFGIKRSIIDHN